MIPQEFESFPLFGDNAEKIKPDDPKYSAGFVPTDVLPAQWFNWFLYTMSKGYNQLCQHADEGFTKTVSTTQTLTPTKVMAVVVNTASVTLTLGNGPWAGYELTVFAGAACTINYTSPGGNVNASLSANQTDTYTWTGSVWMSRLDRVYPVGSIYMSVNNVSPASFIGGTWEQIKDTFLLSAGDTYAAGDTGGEATHTLTTNEIPAHYHRYNNSQSSALVTDSTQNGNYKPVGTDWSATNSNMKLISSTDNAGGSQSHNNMPPYLAVYMWKRTA